MNRSMWTAVIGVVLLAGCGGEDLRFDDSALDLMQGQAIDVHVMRGAADVTGTTTVKVDGDAVKLESGKLEAVKPGQVTLHAISGGDEITATAVVTVPASITVKVPDDVKWTVGGTVQVQAFGHKGNDARELTYGVRYAVNDTRVATVDDKGLVTVKGGGTLVITASLGDMASEKLEAGVSCAYPQGNYGLGYGNTMPPEAFKAVWPDGTRSTLDLSQVPCQGEWGDTSTITFVLSAGWCGPCTAYAQRLVGQVATLEALGMKVVIVEVQDYEGAPADSEFAFEHLGKITNGDRPAIAVGDKDSAPGDQFFAKSGYISYFPTSFVVRTSDMKIIADQKLATSYLPLDQIAADPDANWSYGGGAFENKCAEGDEEAGEPNNAGAQATALSPGMHHGGMCDPSGLDIYSIDLTGAWSVSLDYDNAHSNNLEVWVWDGKLDQIATVKGNIVGSSTGSGHEAFDFSGPALIAVHSLENSSSGYDLTLTEK